METQKIINLLNKNDVESRKFTTRKWYVINDTNNRDYGGLNNNNPSTVKFETKVRKPNFCDYSDAYILVTGTISVVGGNDNNKVAFKNCAPFTKCTVQINDEYVEEADNLDIIAPMYNLIEHSDNYQDSSATLYQYKRDEPPNGNVVITANNSKSFTYKASLLDDMVAIAGAAAGTPNRKIDNAKIVVPLKYLVNFLEH